MLNVNRLFYMLVRRLNFQFGEILMFKTRIKKFFNTIEYFPATSIVREEMELKFVNTCCRCIDMKDIHFLFKQYRFILSRMKQVNKVIKKKSKRNIDWLLPDQSYILDLLEKDYSEGISIFTTAFFKKKNKVSTFSYDEPNIYDVIRKKSNYNIFPEDHYYVHGRYNKMSILSIGSNELLLTIKMKNNWDLILKNNSKYQILYNNNAYEIINKHVDNLGNEENLWAVIDIDLL